MEGTEQPHIDKYVENVNESNYTTICMLTANPVVVVVVVVVVIIIIIIIIIFFYFEGFTSAAHTG